MNMKLSGTTILILSLCSSVTLARTPMGPPTTSHEKGKWSIGFNASETETDLKLHDTAGTTFFTRDTAHDFEIESVMGKLAYGINDNWEISFGFGVSESQYTEATSWTTGPSIEAIGVDFESDSGYTAEIGTRVSIYDDGPLGIGASFQFNWLSLDGTYLQTKWTDFALDSLGGAELEMDIMVFQFAPGISYEIFDDIKLYGGPLWQWIEGDGSADGLNGSLTGQVGEGDIKQDSVFGGLIGFYHNIGSDTTVNFEWSATGSSETFAFSMAKKF